MPVPDAGAHTKHQAWISGLRSGRGRGKGEHTSTSARKTATVSPMRHLLALALILLGTASASSGEHLIVQAPPELAQAAARVRAVGEGDFAAPLMVLGPEDFGPPIRVHLALESSSMALRAPSWAAGYAIRDQGFIVLFPQRTPSYPDRNLEALVHHEVTHVLVARATHGHWIPRWFNEGLATVAAREWGIEDRARTATALIGRGPRSLTELDAAFEGDRSHASRAYALSAAAVRSMLRRHGRESAGTVLTEVGRGIDVDRAFGRATGSSLSAFERHFFDDEAFWSTWVPFLTSSAALWMAITLLALWAIRQRRRRSAEMNAMWEAEEAIQSQVERAFPRPPDSEVVN